MGSEENWWDRDVLGEGELRGEVLVGGLRYHNIGWDTLN